MPKRKDRVAPPPAGDEWDVKYLTTEAVRGWEELCRLSPGPTKECWNVLRTSPDKSKNTSRHHPLKGCSGASAPCWKNVVSRVWRLARCTVLLVLAACTTQTAVTTSSSPTTTSTTSTTVSPSTSTTETLPPEVCELTGAGVGRPRGAVLVNSVTLAGGPFQLAAGAADIWLAGWETGELMRLDPATLEVQASRMVAEPYGPIELAVDGSSLWVSSFSERALIHLDAATLEEHARHPLDLQRGLLLEPEFVWVLCCGPDTEHGLGKLSRLARSTGEVTTVEFTDLGPDDVVRSGESLWILSPAPPALVEVSPTELAEMRRIPLEFPSFLIAVDPQGVVWVGDGIQTTKVKAFIDGTLVMDISLGRQLVDAIAGDGYLLASAEQNTVYAIHIGEDEPVLLEGVSGYTLGLTGNALITSTGNTVSIYCLLR